VDSYDARRGLGVVSTDDGALYDFHATAIADGSRAIAAGTKVMFMVSAGHRGRYEARAVSPI
jgi:cold shock CspA family protein